MKKNFLQTIGQLGINGLQRRGRRVVMFSTMTVLLTSIIAFASIPGPDGVIHACYTPRGNGSLRVIDSTEQCKSNETGLEFNQTGPQGQQGIPGPAGPQGIQGEPGIAGISSRLITVGTGVSDYTIMPSCSEPIRSLLFTKQTEASRLRITYHDTALVGSSTLIPGFHVEVRIDGSEVGPTPLKNGILGGNNLAEGEFTTFGYANAVPAGQHTLTTLYKFNTSSPPTCIRVGAYTIEVEEIP